MLHFLPSPYVVKYYGSYFKNTDLWIVMEYCGAGSVSDIIRLRNKTVGLYTKLQQCVLQLFFKVPLTCCQQMLFLTFINSLVCGVFLSFESSRQKYQK